MNYYLCHFKANKYKFYLITTLLLFLSHISTDLYAQAARTVLNNQSMPDKRIWLFTEPHGMPPWNQATPYGSLYMLDLQENENNPARFSMGTRLLESGITGYIIGTSPGESFNGWKADMMSDFNRNFPAIKMTICVSAGNLNDIVTSVKSYLDVAKNYSNAPMIDGKYVIFTYAPQGTSLSVWKSVRSQLSSAGYNTFFFQDVNINWNNGIPNKSAITSWFQAFDGSYVWTDTNYRNTDNWNNWNWFISLMNSNGNRATLGGMFPAYSRESPNGGYLEDSQGGYKGTYHLREMLQAHLDSHLQWWHISTANDCSEESQLLPSSWWSFSRSDITRLYAYKLGSIPSKPTNSANLYAVSPQHIHLGEALYAESLIVNWDIQTVNSKLELYDGDYNLVTSSEMKPVLAESTGAAVFTNFHVDNLPAKRFFRLKALLFDGNGIEIKSVWGAPICVYETNQSKALRNSNYYVIPANKALPGIIFVSINGNPSLGNATLTVTPPVGTDVRFAEAFQNTKLVYNGTKSQFIQKLSNPYLVSLPTTNYTTAGGEIVNPETTGFYIARIIDTQERVGYSDPIYMSKDATYTKQQKLGEIQFYPNPANENIMFTNPDNRPLIIQIFNLSGNLLLTQTVYNNSLNIKNLSGGLYIMMVNSELYKLVKQ